MTTALLITCEHASNAIPTEYLHLFQQGRDPVLNTHRAFDIGTKALFDELVKTLPCTHLCAKWSRLIVDLNRSLKNPQCLSEFTQQLETQEQKSLLQQYYVPYRNQVTQYVHELIAKHGRLIHLSIHSFTPNLAGKIRQGDIGLLYDPQRAEEKSLCLHWQNLLKQKAPHYRVRRNYPYQGVSDSIMRPFRREYSSKKYIGIELESNQAILQGDQSRFHTRILVQTLASRIG